MDIIAEKDSGFSSTSAVCELGLTDLGSDREQLQGGDTNGVASSNFDGDYPERVEQETPSTSTSHEADIRCVRETRRAGGNAHFGGEDAERRYKLWLRAEIVGLCVLIVIVWGLLSLPIVFYDLPVVSKSLIVGVGTTVKLMLA